MKHLMKTKKLKRFADGGEVDGAFNEAGSGPSDDSSPSPAPAPAPERKQSFSEAFAAARRSGAKTFEWNGKKFGTQLASPKPSAPRAEAPAKRSSLSQRLGQDYATYERAARNMPEGSSSAAREAVMRNRDQAKAAYEKAAESERTGKSVVKLANGGLVKRGTLKSHGKAC